MVNLAELLDLFHFIDIWCNVQAICLGGWLRILAYHVPHLSKRWNVRQTGRPRKCVEICGCNNCNNSFPLLSLGWQCTRYLLSFSLKRKDNLLLKTTSHYCRVFQSAWEPYTASAASCGEALSVICYRMWTTEA